MLAPAGRIHISLIGANLFLMSLQQVFIDETDTNTEMKFYINDSNRLYIQIENRQNDYGFGYITLSKEDLSLLIDKLTKTEKKWKVG